MRNLLSLLLLTGVAFGQNVFPPAGGSGTGGTFTSQLSAAAVSRTTASKLQDFTNVLDFGAVGSGSSSPVSGWCTNHSGTRYTAANDTACLTTIQAQYSWVTSVSDEMDEAAFCAAVAVTDTVQFGAGTFIFNRTANCGGGGTVINGNGTAYTFIKNTAGYAFQIPTSVEHYTIQNLTIEPQAGSSGGIYLGLNWEHVRIINVNIFQPSEGTYVGVYADHLGIDIYMNMVRVFNGQYGWEFDIPTGTGNDVICEDCYSDTPSSTGFYFNGLNSVTLINAKADTAATAFRVDGVDNTVFINPTMESATVHGIQLFGSVIRNVTIVNPHFFADTCPIEIDGANASVNIINPFSTSTPASSCNSLDITAGHHVAVWNIDNLDLGLSTAANTFLSANLGALRSDGTSVPASVSVGSVGTTIDGGGSVITTGAKGYIQVPYNATITGWTILGDQSGSTVIDVKRATYAGFPTFSSIAGTDLPTLSSAQKNTDATLTGWGNTTVTAGDIIQFVVNSATTVTRVNILVTLQRN